MNKRPVFIFCVLLLFVLGILVVTKDRPTAYPVEDISRGNLQLANRVQQTGIGEFFSGKKRQQETVVAGSITEGQVPAIAPGGAQDQRLIIKTGTLALVVENVSDVTNQIATYAKQSGGFVVVSTMDEQGIAPTGSITIRIPENIFDSAVSDIGAWGRIESKSVNGQDVTEEYVDLEAQLKNLRATEEQFLAIMKKAEKIPDILEVQRELSNVRGEIERIQGRMKYLKESASLSTLTVYMSTDPAALPTVDPEDAWKPKVVIKEALRSLVEVGKSVVNVLIWFVIYVPVWIVFGLIIWVGYRWMRKRQAQ